MDIENLEETGFCWKCGTRIGSGKFCKPKHEEQWQRDQERQIKRGKRAGYGLAGSTH